MRECYQRDVKHKRDRLYVHWDVTAKCNYNCSYCYAKNCTYTEEWGDSALFTTQQLIIHSIRRSTLPVFLGMLGGEPTVDPNYHKLVKLSHDAISTHPDGRLYVTTNGSKSIDWWNEHPYYPNMYILWSVHFEYVTDLSEYVAKIDLMAKRGFKNKVNVMLNPDPETWGRTIELFTLLDGIDVEVHPHFLYKDGDVHNLYEYSAEFYKTFDFLKEYPKYFEYGVDGDIQVYNDYEVFTQHMTNFKGWKCYNNNYEINMSGTVNRFCFNETSNLKTNFNFFRDITTVSGLPCPHESCNCDGLLKVYKEK